MKLYVKDGILEKVEGDPEQSITKGAMPIRMLSLPEYVYSPYRILHPMKRDPEKRGDDSAWEQCSWDEAYDLICDNVRRITDEYGSNVLSRIQQPEHLLYADGLVLLWASYGVHILCAGRSLSGAGLCFSIPEQLRRPSLGAP